MARKWSNRNLPGALHYITGNVHNRFSDFRADGVLPSVHRRMHRASARLVKSVGDYRWSSYNSFYFKATDPIEVDRDWWWPDDVRKLSVAAAEWSREMAEATQKKKR